MKPLWARAAAAAASWDARTLRRLVLVGFLARLALFAFSVGSNDIGTWERFAGELQRWGVLEEYRRNSAYNHPPLIGWWAVFALRAAAATSIPFRFWFKLLPLISDVVATRLVFLIGARRGTNVDGWRAAAAFSTAMVSVWITSHHGNTDSLCALLVLVAAWALTDRDSPFLAGLALAGALNVKLIPLVVIPAMVVQLRSPGAAMQFAGGLGVGLLPFLEPALGAWNEFQRNAIQYGSSRNRWGARFFLLGFQEIQIAKPVVKHLETAYVAAGRYLIMALNLGAGIIVRRRGLTSYHACTVALAIFLFFIPGFAIQYMVYPLAVLVVVDLRRATLYGVIAGIFVAADYLHYARTWFPLLTIHGAPFSWWVAFLGVAAWLVLGELLDAFVRGRDVWAPSQGRPTNRNRFPSKADE